MFSLKLIPFNLQTAREGELSLRELYQKINRGEPVVAEELRAAGLPMAKYHLEQAIQKGTIRDIIKNYAPEVLQTELIQVVRAEGVRLGARRTDALLRALDDNTCYNLGITDPDDVRFLIRLLNPSIKMEELAGQLNVIQRQGKKEMRLTLPISGLPLRFVREILGDGDKKESLYINETLFYEGFDGDNVFALPSAEETRADEASLSQEQISKIERLFEWGQGRFVPESRKTALLRFFTETNRDAGISIADIELLIKVLSCTTGEAFDKYEDELEELWKKGIFVEDSKASNDPLLINVRISNNNERIYILREWEER